jgi:Protein of unknown function (DUF429)
VPADNASQPPSPEVAPLAGKKTARGRLQRHALVRAAFGDAEVRSRDGEWSATGNLDDALDAYAALWSALRIVRRGIDGVETLGRAHAEAGEGHVLRDAEGTGLRMRILL